MEVHRMLLTVVDPWADSGCAELTAEGVAAPDVLVEGVLDHVRALDARGAGLAAEFPGGGLGVLAQRARLVGLERSGRVSCGGATRLLATADGEIALCLARPADIDLLPAWAALAGGDVGNVPARALAAAAAELGLPCGAAGEVTDRRPAIVRRLGDAPSRPPGGARVVNLGVLWAAPLAAHLLARIGADVVAVESTGRLDGARATPAFFDALRVGVRGIAIDFSVPAALSALLATADVVIEGSRPRALRQLGIRAEDLVKRRSSGPQVWVSVTAYGRADPHGMRVGFGDDTAAAGGLLGRTRDGETVFLADAIADPLTGLTVAATVAELLEQGGRHFVDIALARVAAAHAPR